MTLFRAYPLYVLVALAAFADATSQPAVPSPNSAQFQPATASPTNSPIIYVSDFDLDIVYRKPTPRPAPRNVPPSAHGGNASSTAGSTKTTPSSSSRSNSSRSNPASDSSTEMTPADRANALVNAVSESILRALQQAGYAAQRLPAGAPLPKLGVRLRGVFAEADERNRARRLLVGGEPVAPNMILFVGVNNLSRPEQPLYLLADPPIPDPRHGPVITVTSYAPAARFELSREPSDEELRKISTQIAADLTALLSANRLSFAQ
jgi:Domain of unknown function (DUF4410)